MIYFILPVICFLFGILLNAKPDMKNNSLFGFRTKTSSVNEDTWKYCNALCAKFLLFIGIVSITAVLAVRSMTVKIFGLLPVELVHVAMIIAILAEIPIINYLCKKNTLNTIKRMMTVHHLISHHF